MDEVSQASEVDKPADFADLNVSQQTHALCLAAREKVGVSQIIEWIKFGRKELTDEEVSEINETYDGLSGEIPWDGEDNDRLIREELGVDSKTVHSAIADAIMSKIKF